MGTLVICAPNNAHESELVLHNVLHAPSIGYTLVSLGALDEEGYTSHIAGRHLRITSLHKEQITDITRTHHLYQVKHSPEFAHVAELMSFMELHRRLRHISVISACKLVQSRAVKGIKLDPNAPETDCKACIFACATCLPIYKPRVSVPAQSFGDKIHSNIWGPVPVLTPKGARYFITFTDDSMHFTVTYLLRTKDKVLKQYKSVEAWVIAQQHCSSIKVLRSDRGGKYLSKAFDKHLAAASIAWWLTTHDMPQLNSITEWLNRTLLEHIRALRHASGLPKMLWGEALHHATWLKNGQPHAHWTTKRPSRCCTGQHLTSQMFSSGAARPGCTTTNSPSWTLAHMKASGSASTSMLGLTGSTSPTPAPSLWSRTCTSCQQVRLRGRNHTSGSSAASRLLPQTLP